MSRTGDSAWEPEGASAAGSAAREEAASAERALGARRTGTCRGQRASLTHRSPLPSHAALSQGTAETARAAKTDSDSAAESRLSRHPRTGSESRVPQKADPDKSVTGSRSPAPRVGTGNPAVQGHRLEQQLQKFSAPFCLETSLSPTCFAARCAEQQGQAELGHTGQQPEAAGSCPRGETPGAGSARGEGSLGIHQEHPGSGAGDRAGPSRGWGCLSVWECYLSS